MERNMPSYVRTMSDGDFEILEDIFENKYNEFIDCYWLLKEYTEYINDLAYKKDKKDLSLEVVFTKLKASDVASGLKDRIPNGKKVDICYKKNTIYITFFKD